MWSGGMQAEGQDPEWRRRLDMKKWLRRIRGAMGMGLAWAVAGGAVGTIINLGFVVRTGSRPDAPFPIMLGAFGFVAGVVFSGSPEAY